MFSINNTYQDEHIHYNIDKLYISNKLASLLLNREIKTNNNIDRKQFYMTPHFAKYYKKYSCQIFIVDVPYITNVFLIAGANGVRGFGGLEYSSAEKFKRPVINEVYKYVFDFYFNSKLNRLGKIKKLMGNV